MDGHLIVMSVDAMVCEDIAHLRTLPNFGRLLDGGSLVRRMTTIYPSLTHPVHAALMSGCPAGRTGIVNNTVFSPGNPEPRWLNRLDEVRCDTLFHAAKRAGLTTAACRWPMTAGGFDWIDYLVPEVLDADMRQEPDLERLYRGACSPAIFDDIVRPKLDMLRGRPRHPAYEDFSMACAADILRQYRPNLLLTHPGLVDSARHDSGLFSPEVDAALDRTDVWLGWLMDAAWAAGIADETSYAIVSDHGQLARTRSVALNVLLVEKGYITLDASGRVSDWVVWAQESGLSCQVYVKDPARAGEVYDWLMALRDAGTYGFDQVLTREACRERYGLDGDFSFVLEGDGHTEFRGDWRGPFMRPATGGNHGHMPHKGPQPPMIVSGPMFQGGVTIERGSLLDEAPTFAAALGLTLDGAMGKPLRELLRTETVSI